MGSLGSGNSFDYMRNINTDEFLKIIGEKTGVPLSEVKRLHKETKNNIEWGFRYRCIDTGVKTCTYLIKKKAAEDSKSNLNNKRVENILEIFKSINNENIKLRKSSDLSYFVSELEYNGRCHRAIGKTKKQAIFNIKKHCAIVEASGDWISGESLDSLSDTVTMKLKRVGEV